MANKVTTSTEVFLLEIILKNTSQASIDWDAVANATGMSMGGARNKLGFITKEYLKTKPDADMRPNATTMRPPPPPTTTPKRKAKESAIASKDEPGDKEDAAAKGDAKTPKSKKFKTTKQVAEEDTGAEEAKDDDQD